MYSYSKFIHNYTKSPFNYEEPISKDFRVFVNGEEIPVYTCRKSRVPFNRAWPGHQRQIDQTELASFVNIVSDEEIKIEVIVNKEYKNVMLRPFSKNISLTEKDGKFSFTLKDEAQLVFACDDLHCPLYIFNTKPILCESKDDVTYYFGPGVHMPGKIVLHDGESVYVDKDALVFGYIYAENASNIRVFGNGLFDDMCEERYFVHCYEEYPNGNIKFFDCKNVSLEGVLFRNSCVWCVNFFHCFDCVVDNIKVFGQWRYNADGIDFVNSQNIVLKNSFINSFDDTVVIKGIDRYVATDNVNILTQNCVLWCDWGKCLELGLETACREYKNIVFKDCDIIRSTKAVFDIMDGDSAEISDVLFENINVEYNSFDTVPVLQESDDQVYDANNEPMAPLLLYLGNPRFRERYANDTWKIPEEMANVSLDGIQYATIHDVTIRNINVYYDEKLAKVDGKWRVEFSAFSHVPGVRHYNINVSDIKINGQKVTQDDVIMNIKDTDNFIFE